PAGRLPRRGQPRPPHHNHHEGELTMGLHAYTEETRTEAWYGAYSAFGRWQDTLAAAAEVQIDWGHITNDNLVGKWEATPSDPLVVLIAHSDCDGEIHPDQAGPLADRLEDLLPQLPSRPDSGHIGDWAATTQKFIAALRESAESGQKVMFA